MQNVHPSSNTTQATPKTYCYYCKKDTSYLNLSKIMETFKKSRVKVFCNEKKEVVRGSSHAGWLHYRSRHSWNTIRGSKGRIYHRTHQHHWPGNSFPLYSPLSWRSGA